MSSKSNKRKKFTLDFSKWCVGGYTATVNNVEKACAYQQAKDQLGENVVSPVQTEVIQINDSRISRREKVDKIR